MAQKTSPLKPTSAAKSIKKTFPNSKTALSHAAPQDDLLWDIAIANSIEAIRELADKALADKQARRTKKITL